jgi:putative hydrolase of HD superfamily
LQVDKREKHAREAAAVVHMRSLLGSDAWERCGEELVALWEEYEAGATPESKLLKDLDKVEMILQAHEYESRPATPGAIPPALDEFFTSTEGKFVTPVGKALAAEVVARRTSAAADMSR